MRTPKEGSAEEKATQATVDAREGNALIKSGLTDVVPFFLFNFDSEYEDSGADKMDANERREGSSSGMVEICEL
jgi:hypothetical protein